MLFLLEQWPLKHHNLKLYGHCGPNHSRQGHNKMKIGVAKETVSGEKG
jgi:hypothetical protein